MTLDKKILFISQGVSFMGNSIQRNLEVAGYEVTRIDPVVEQISKTIRDNVFLSSNENFSR